MTLTLLPIQDAFVGDTHRYAALCGPRGGGKSTAGCTKAVRYALAHAGAHLLICAPTYPMLRHSTLPTFLAVCPAEEIERYARAEDTVHFRSGSTVSFMALDSERLAGLSVAAVYVDEVLGISGDVWQEAIRRLRQPSYPHQAWLTTQSVAPPWVWEEFEPDDDHALYHLPEGANPYREGQT